MGHRASQVHHCDPARPSAARPAELREARRLGRRVPEPRAGRHTGGPGVAAEDGTGRGTWWVGRCWMYTMLLAGICYHF